MFSFDSNSLICGPTLFPSKNSPNIAKSNRVFPGKRKEDRALILIYLNSPMADVFPHYSLSFSISAIFRGKRVIKVWSKVKSLGSSLFYENSNPSNYFKQWFLAILHHIWRSKGQKPSKKNCGTQNFESFYLHNHKCYCNETYHDYISSWECKPKNS